MLHHIKQQFSVLQLKRYREIILTHVSSLQLIHFVFLSLPSCYALLQAHDSVHEITFETCDDNCKDMIKFTWT